MVYLIIAVIVTFALLLVARWWLRRAPRYRRVLSDDLTKFFKPLLDENYPASFLVIEAGSNKFIQFRRYMLNGKSGIQLDFPRAPWSEKYFGTLERIL